jgi:SAM-dependent methyltransferase
MAHKEQQDFFEEVSRKFPEYFTNVKVLDIGSLDINGNTRRLLKQPYYYTGLDLDAGPNVDVVCPAHLYDCGYKFDLIMSGECFEHDMFYTQTLRNITNLLKPGGLFVFTCASTDRPEHGTLRTSPENAPFLEKYGEDWCNYYKNLTESDIRDVLEIDDIFEDYYFQESFSGYIGNDLYFWGIKKLER